MLPYNRFTFDNVNYVNNVISHSIPNFYFEDPNFISIKNFHYTSVNTKTNDQMTGFKLINISYLKGISNFELEIENFSISNMFLEDQNLFDIP